MRKSAVFPASIAVTGILISILVNLGTNVVPDGWTWLRNPTIVWTLIAGGILATITLVLVDARNRSSSPQAPSTKVTIRNSGRATLNYYASRPIGDGDTAHSRYPPSVYQFVGRAGEVESACEALKLGIRQVCVLEGMGGVGKTQLALEICRLRNSSYKILLWIKASAPETIAQQLAVLAPSLGIAGDLKPKDSYDLVLDRLAVRSDWLLVFDNVDGPNSVLDYLPRGDGHILITTRSTSCRTLGKVVKVDVFRRQDTLDFMESRGVAEGPDSESLADLLGDLPLALEQALSYVKYTHLTLSKYIEIWRERSTKLLTRGEVVGYEHTLATTWTISVDRLREDSAASVALLEHLAFLASSLVPHFLFTEHHDLLPGPLGEAATDFHDFVECVAALAGLSLCETFESEGEYEIRAMVVHPVVATATRANIEEPQARGIVESLVAVLAADMPENASATPEFWPWWQFMGTHVSELVEFAFARNLRTKPFAALLTEMGAMAARFGDLDVAERCVDRAQKVIADTYGGNSGPEARILDDKASLLEQRGHLAAALPLRRRSYEISREKNGDDSDATMRYSCHLAHALTELDQIEEAERLLQNYYSWADQRYGPTSDKVSHAANLLGSLYLRVGRKRQAYELISKSYEIERAQERPNPLDLASGANALGAVCFELGEYEEAVNKMNEAVELHQAVYGLQHPVVASDMANLGALLRMLGNESQAAVVLRRAFDVLKECGQGRSLGTLQIMQNLAGTLASIGDVGEAETLYLESIDIEAQVLGVNHRLFAQALGNYGTFLYKEARYSEAKRVLERCVDISQKLGEIPSLTLARRLRLIAQCMLHLGEIKAARRLLRRATKEYEKDGSTAEELAEVRELLQESE